MQKITTLSVTVPTAAKSLAKYVGKSQSSFVLYSVAINIKNGKAEATNKYILRSVDISATIIDGQQLEHVFINPTHWSRVATGKPVTLNVFDVADCDGRMQRLVMLGDIEVGKYPAVMRALDIQRVLAANKPSAGSRVVLGKHTAEALRKICYAYRTWRDRGADITLHIDAAAKTLTAATKDELQCVLPIVSSDYTGSINFYMNELMPILADYNEFFINTIDTTIVTAQTAISQALIMPLFRCDTYGEPLTYDNTTDFATDVAAAINAVSKYAHSAFLTVSKYLPIGAYNAREIDDKIVGGSIPCPDRTIKIDSGNLHIACDAKYTFEVLAKLEDIVRKHTEFITPGVTMLDVLEPERLNTNKIGKLKRLPLLRSRGNWYVSSSCRRTTVSDTLYYNLHGVIFYVGNRDDICGICHVDDGDADMLNFLRAYSVTRPYYADVLARVNAAS